MLTEEEINIRAREIAHNVILTCDSKVLRQVAKILNDEANR